MEHIFVPSNCHKKVGDDETFCSIECFSLRCRKAIIYISDNLSIKFKLLFFRVADLPEQFIFRKQY